MILQTYRRTENLCFPVLVLRKKLFLRSVTNLIIFMYGCSVSYLIFGVPTLDRLRLSTVR